MFGCRRNANFRLGLFLLALQIHSQKPCLAKTSRMSGRSLWLVSELSVCISHQVFPMLFRQISMISIIRRVHCQFE